ncbi:MAG: hypothetical protein C0403_04190 [Desulfobacterium sp.]|nr:hypothetical protein [Desulfobacterium sp.]
MIKKENIFHFAFAFLYYLMSIQAQAAVITFTPRLSLEEEYTSNFFLTSDHEEYDYTTIVSPGFITQLQGRTGSVSLYYDPAYHYNSDHTDYNSWAHSAGITGTQQATRNTAINFTNSFLYTSEPTETHNIFSAGNEPSATTQTSGSRPTPSFDSGAAPVSNSGSTSAFDSAGNQGARIINRDISQRRSRMTYYTNSANLGMAHQFGANDTMRLDYTYTILENDDPTIDDNQSHSPSVLISYWLLPNQWRVEAGGTYIRGILDGPSDDFNNWQGDFEVFKQFNRHFEGLVRYNHSSMLFDGDTDDEHRDEDYQIYNPSIGIRYVPREDTHIQVSVGYYIQDQKISEDDSGFIVNCDLEHTWIFRQATIQVTGASGYDIASLDAENLGFRLYYGGGINAQYRFSRYLNGHLFSTYQWDDYPSGDSTAEEDREDHNLEYGLGFSWQALSWLSTRVQGSSRLLKSTLHENDFIDNRVLLGITISPSQPYRY